jgi:hypothetical protein
MDLFYMDLYSSGSQHNTKIVSSNTQIQKMSRRIVGKRPGKRVSLSSAAAKKRKVSKQDSDGHNDDHNSIGSGSSTSSEEEKVAGPKMDDNGGSETDEGGGGKQKVVETPVCLQGTVDSDTPLPVPMKGMNKQAFTAANVRGTTTNQVFRAVHVLNTHSLINSTMARLATIYDVKPEECGQWKGLYQREVVYALNNKRNSVYQDIKPKFEGKERSSNMNGLLFLINQRCAIQRC